MLPRHHSRNEYTRGHPPWARSSESLFAMFTPNVAYHNPRTGGRGSQLCPPASLKSANRTTRAKPAGRSTTTTELATFSSEMITSTTTARAGSTTATADGCSRAAEPDTTPIMSEVLITAVLVEDTAATVEGTTRQGADIAKSLNQSRRDGSVRHAGAMEGVDRYRGSE